MKRNYGDPFVVIVQDEKEAKELQALLNAYGFDLDIYGSEAYPATVLLGTAIATYTGTRPIITMPVGFNEFACLYDYRCGWTSDKVKLNAIMVPWSRKRKVEQLIQEFGGNSNEN